MTTTDRAAILRAVLEEPADDLHRLAYADLCEETGDSQRSAFIRCQLELARLEQEECRCSSYDPTGCSRCRSGARLSRQAEDTFRSHGWRWLALRDHAFGRFGICHPTLWRLGIDCHSTDWRQVFRRGFAERVEMDTAHFLGYAEALFRHHPITDVWLMDKTGVGWKLDEPKSPYHRWHGWSSSNPVEEDDDIPHVLFDLLASGRRDPSRENVVFYDTQDAALADLSRACVAHGRNLAGLPALDREDSR